MNANRTPWIIGGAVAAFVACVLLLVCVSAFLLLGRMTAAQQAVPLQGPVATLALPTPAGQAPGTASIVKASPDDDPALGPAGAPVTIIEFSDFQCPYCKRFRDQTLDALMKEYEGKVRLVYRDFPLTTIHPEAMDAALAADCANAQGKFWKMHDLLFDNQDQFGLKPFKQLAGQLQLDQGRFDQCFDSQQYLDEIQHDIDDGTAYGVSGTPTFFINGRSLVGAQPLSAFENLINEALQP